MLVLQGSSPSSPPSHHVGCLLVQTSSSKESLTSANALSPLLFLRWISFLTNQQESTLSFLPLVIPSDLPGSSKGKKAKGGATPTSTAPRPIVESETWTPFLTVECRGLETVGFEWEVRFSPSFLPFRQTYRRFEP